MQERDAIVAGGLVLLILALPLGYLVHVSPRFPGSLAGSAIGILAALLMTVPLIYLLVKRIPWLKGAVTQVVSMRTLLAIHIYAGLAGPVLALLHGAHKFRSPLGLSLVGMMLVVVLSGYTGRYLLGRIARGVEARRSELAALWAANAAAADPLPPSAPTSGGKTRFLTVPLRDLFFDRPDPIGATAAADHRRALADALADAEQALRIEETMRDLFARWLKLHIVIATILYVLLVLHIWAGLYYGLRWLR